MQQVAPQTVPAGLPAQSAFGQPFAQPQAFLQQPYGGQQMGPGGPQMPLGAPPGQPIYQPQQAAPAPIAPVSAPTYAPSGNMQQGSQQPQNPYSRPAVAIARTLEQAIPGYQFLISVLQDLTSSPRGESVAQAAPAVLELMREVSMQHFSALGAIRRLLVGEPAADVAIALALAVNQLIRLHSQLRPHMERLSMNAAPDLRPSITSLGQAVSANDMLLGQASAAIQQVFGPQVWEAARTRVFGNQGQPGI